MTRIMRWPWTVTALIALGLGLTLGIARCEGSGPHPFTTTAAVSHGHGLYARDECGNYASRLWIIWNPGHQAVTAYIKTRLNSGHLYALGHPVIVPAHGSAEVITVRGTSLRLGYPADGAWAYRWFASHVSVCPPVVHPSPSPSVSPTPSPSPSPTPTTTS